MKIHHCDRCNAEIPTKNISPYNRAVLNGETFELCDNCINELRRFLLGTNLVQWARMPEIYKDGSVLCTECGFKIGEKEACEKDEDNRVEYCPWCGTKVNWIEWEESLE